MSPFPYHINCTIQRNKERTLEGGKNGRLRIYVHMTEKTDMDMNKALMVLKNKKVC